jgi:hypothetical protein
MGSKAARHVASLINRDTCGGPKKAGSNYSVNRGTTYVNSVRLNNYPGANTCELNKGKNLLPASSKRVGALVNGRR